MYFNVFVSAQNVKFLFWIFLKELTALAALSIQWRETSCKSSIKKRHLTEPFMFIIIDFIDFKLPCQKISLLSMSLYVHKGLCAQSHKCQRNN